MTLATPDSPRPSCTRFRRHREQRGRVGLPAVTGRWVGLDRRVGTMPAMPIALMLASLTDRRDFGYDGLYWSASSMVSGASCPETAVTCDWSRGPGRSSPSHTRAPAGGAQRTGTSCATARWCVRTVSDSFSRLQHASGSRTPFHSRSRRKRVFSVPRRGGIARGCCGDPWPGERRSLLAKSAARLPHRPEGSHVVLDARLD
jgi:hypothetical protein